MSETMSAGVHWQDPADTMYNTPACGAPNIAPATTDPRAVTCGVCMGIARV